MLCLKESYETGFSLRMPCGWHKLPFPLQNILMDPDHVKSLRKSKPFLLALVKTLCTLERGPGNPKISSSVF